MNKRLSLLGQQVYFWGDPYRLGTHGESSGSIQLFPFIKSGVLSAIDSRQKDAVILYVDGDNNPGFSCGPIVYKDSKINVFRVAGVIRDLAGRKCLLLKREFTKFQSRSIQRFIYKGKYRYFDLAQYKTHC